MSVDATTLDRPSPTLALAGGWLAGIANAVMAALFVVMLGGADREWGMLGPIYRMRFVAIIIAVAWVAGTICFGLAVLQRRQGSSLAGATGILWLAFTGQALLGLLLGLAQVSAVDDVVILGGVTLLAAYIVTAVLLKTRGARAGMWGFIVALGGVLALFVGFASSATVFLFIGGVLFYGGAALGFIAGGRALA